MVNSLKSACNRSAVSPSRRYADNALGLAYTTSPDALKRINPSLTRGADSGSLNIDGKGKRPWAIMVANSSALATYAASSAEPPSRALLLACWRVTAPTTLPARRTGMTSKSNPKLCESATTISPSSIARATCSTSLRSASWPTTSSGNTVGPVVGRTCATAIKPDPPRPGTHRTRSEKDKSARICHSPNRVCRPSRSVSVRSVRDRTTSLSVGTVKG